VPDRESSHFDNVITVPITTYSVSKVASAISSNLNAFATPQNISASQAEPCRPYYLSSNLRSNLSDSAGRTRYFSWNAPPTYNTVPRSQNHHSGYSRRDYLLAKGDSSLSYMENKPAGFEGKIKNKFFCNGINGLQKTENQTCNK